MDAANLADLEYIFLDFNLKNVSLFMRLSIKAPRFWMEKDGSIILSPTQTYITVQFSIENLQPNTIQLHPCSDALYTCFQFCHQNTSVFKMIYCHVKMGIVIIKTIPDIVNAIYKCQSSSFILQCLKGLYCNVWKRTFYCFYLSFLILKIEMLDHSIYIVDNWLTSGWHKST